MSEPKKEKKEISPELMEKYLELRRETIFNLNERLNKEERRHE